MYHKWQFKSSSAKPFQFPPDLRGGGWRREEKEEEEEKEEAEAEAAAFFINCFLFTELL